MAGQRKARWLRALGLLVFPIRGIVSTGKMIAYLLTLAVGISLAGLTAWAKSDPYRGALVITGLLALSGFVAIVSLLKQLDELSRVRADVSITHAEVREYFVAAGIRGDYSQVRRDVVPTGESVTLQDALLVRFSITLRNDGDSTRFFIPEVSLWRRRLLGWTAIQFRQEHVRVSEGIAGAEYPLAERWMPERFYSLASKDIRTEGVFLVATIVDAAPELYKQRLEFRLKIDILGSGELVASAPLRRIRRTYQRPIRPPVGPPPTTASGQGPPSSPESSE